MVLYHLCGILVEPVLSYHGFVPLFNASLFVFGFRTLVLYHPVCALMLNWPFCTLILYHSLCTLSLCQPFCTLTLYQQLVPWFCASIYVPVFLYLGFLPAFLCLLCAFWGSKVSRHGCGGQPIYRTAKYLQSGCRWVKNALNSCQNICDCCCFRRIRDWQILFCLKTFLLPTFFATKHFMAGRVTRFHGQRCIALRSRQSQEICCT